MLEKEIRERDHIIQGKDGEITTKNSTIKDLQAEIERLISMNASGGHASQELQRLLAESEARNKEAMSKID